MTERRVRLIVALAVMLIVAVGSYLIVSAGRPSTGKLASNDSSSSTSIPSVRYASPEPGVETASASATIPYPNTGVPETVYVAAPSH